MQQLTEELQKLNLKNECGVHIGVVAFNLYSNDVTEVSFVCSNWTLQYPFVFQVYTRHRARENWAEPWHIVKAKLADLIKLANLKIIFTYEAMHVALLLNMLGGGIDIYALNNLGCKMQVNTLLSFPCSGCAAKFLLFKPIKYTCAGKQSLHALEWIKENILKMH